MNKEQMESLKYEKEGLKLMLCSMYEYPTILTQSEYDRIETRLNKRIAKIDALLTQKNTP